MLSRARLCWEEQNVRVNWMDKEVIDELLVYSESNGFEEKYENTKKLRASEKKGCLNIVGSINIAEHVR